MTARLPLFAVLAAVTALGVAAPASAQSVDLDRFDGRWYEVARNPNRLQRDCWRLTIDWTAQEEAGRYSVNNTCIRADNGRTDTLRANARLTDPAAAQFRMTLTGALSFGGLAGQNYRVWDHAPDYSWVIMGLPDKRFWWIWSRSANPTAAVRQATVARAAELGFDTSNVVTTGE